MSDPLIRSLSSQQSQNTTIDQLCYTWSTIGYNSSLAAGFRIRAASPGLQGANDDRVKSLDRYLRYSLPEGADRFEVQKNLEQAPICLAFIQSDQERILVHKKYIGEDGVHRLGNFFIHLLAGLSSEFSVKEAISLWRSTFWQISNETLGSSTQLDPLSSAKLLQYHQPIDVLHPPKIESSWAESMFPHFLLAYLQWRKRWEGWQASSGEPPRLYIAAPPDMIAAFLYGLTICLPQQLLTDLTFSTYEEDVKKSHALLIGTCWLPDSDGKISLTHDLPRECYSPNKGIALNCYRSMRKLKPNDLPYDRFVSNVLGWLKDGMMEELEELVADTNGMMPMNVDQFLKAYYDFVVDASNFTREKVETSLTSPNRAIRMLGRQAVQRQINTWALSDPNWSKTQLVPLLEKLSKQCAYHPKLAEALQAYAESVSDQMLEKVALQQGNHFNMMLSILRTIIPPQHTPDPWLELLAKLKEHLQTTLVFFSKNVNLYYKVLWLLQMIQPHVNIQHITPLLKIFWTDSETFFSLDLLLEWKRIAFLSDPLSTPVVLYEEQNKRIAIQKQGQQFRRFVLELGNRVTSDDDWLKLEEVFEQLAEYGYPNKLSLLKILMESPMSMGRQQVVVKKARLQPEERKWFLQDYGPIYIPSPQTQDIIWEEYAILVKAAPPSWKKDILYSWLRPLPYDKRPYQISSIMTNWLAMPENLEFLLKKVDLVPSEHRAFLEDHGSNYFGDYTRQNPNWFSSAKYLVLTTYIVNFEKHFEIEALKTSQFLTFLHNRIPTDLVENTRNNIACLSILQDFFFQRLPPNKHTLEHLNNALSRSLLKKYTLLIDLLAEAFAQRINDETHLSLLVNIITNISKFDVLQLFYGMAEKIRDYAEDTYKNANHGTKDLQDLQLVYIRFALCFEDVYPDLSDAKHAHFLYTFLDLLLQPVDDKNITLLDASICHSEKWDKYKKSRSIKLIQPTNDRSFQQRGLQDEAMVKDSFSIKLPKGVRGKEDSLLVLKDFYRHPSPKKDVLIMIAGALSWVSSREDTILIENLAQAFASCIESETHLSLVISIIIINAPSFSRFDILQLLYSMAEYVRDNVANLDNQADEHVKNLQSLVMPYIYFVFSLKDVYPNLSDSEYTYFLQFFLDLLLQAIDDPELTLLDAGMRRSEKWDKYKKSRSTKSESASNGINILRRRSPDRTLASEPSYGVVAPKRKGVSAQGYQNSRGTATQSPPATQGQNFFPEPVISTPSGLQTKVLALLRWLDGALLERLFKRVSNVNPIMKLKKSRAKLGKARQTQAKQGKSGSGR